jgi:hypothetical protein
MKNIFYVAYMSFLLSLISFVSNGQSCTPNNDTVSGIEPDTLAIAYANVPYEEIIYFRLPPDTIVPIIDTFLALICIDSLTIDSVHGLPDGFTFGCNVPWCSVLGGGNGCASITGTATQGQGGFYPLEVFVTIYTNDCYTFALPPQYDTVTFYYLEVEEGLGMGDASPANDFSLGTSFPNPVSDIANIPYFLQKAGDLNISILNLDGRICFQKNISEKPGYHVQPIDVSGLNEGSYFIRLEYAGRNLFSKLVVLK